MRASLLLVVSAALLAALVVMTRTGDPGAPPAPPTREPLADAPGPRAAAGSPEPLPAAPAPDGPERTPPPPRQPFPEDGPTRAFRGVALIQPPGERPRQATAGTLHLELIGGGARETREVPLPGGRFDLEVPARARLVLHGAELDGRRVHFEAPRGPFDPSENDYALVGIPTPEFRLIVREGGQGAPLAGVRVSRVEDATSAWLGETPPAADAIVEGAASPVLLPHLGVSRPVRLRVEAEGHAATHVLVDPREPGEKVVTLWPAADLDLRLTGPGRGRVKLLVLGRATDDGARRHAATFQTADARVEADPSGLTLPIRGLAAVAHLIVAKGHDAQGRTFDLGELRVELGPGERKLAELYVP